MNVGLESCGVEAVGDPVFMKTNSSLCDLTYAFVVGVSPALFTTQSKTLLLRRRAGELRIKRRVAGK